MTRILLAEQDAPTGSWCALLATDLATLAGDQQWKDDAEDSGLARFCVRVGIYTGAKTDKQPPSDKKQNRHTR